MSCSSCAKALFASSRARLFFLASMLLKSSFLVTSNSARRTSKRAFRSATLSCAACTAATAMSPSTTADFVRLDAITTPMKATARSMAHTPTIVRQRFTESRLLLHGWIFQSNFLAGLQPLGNQYAISAPAAHLNDPFFEFRSAEDVSHGAARSLK